MCIFSGTRHVEVSGTNIYARMATSGVQVLAYAMDLAADFEVAMVLPIPVVPGSGDDVVTFIDLQGSPKLFSELAALFVPPTLGFGPPMQGLGPVASLKIHDVGSFVASYVPTREDFTRLDPRFRIPEVVFDAVPHYADFGFVVFQLAPARSTIHPMAFTFPTRQPDWLFFPTVHVHDGAFQPDARFDHSLYYQHARCTEPATRFDGDPTSWQPVNDPYMGVTRRGLPVARRQRIGMLPNEDTWIAAT